MASASRSLKITSGWIIAFCSILIILYGMANHYLMLSFAPVAVEQQISSDTAQIIQLEQNEERVDKSLDSIKEGITIIKQSLRDHGYKINTDPPHHY